MHKHGGDSFTRERFSSEAGEECFFPPHTEQTRAKRSDSRACGFGGAAASKWIDPSQLSSVVKL